MFVSKYNFCNYADDNTLNAFGTNLYQIGKNLEMDFMILHKWFHENHRTFNPEKCRYKVMGSKDLPYEIMLSKKEISSNEEKLLGIFLESRLNFEVI